MVNVLNALFRTVLLASVFTAALAVSAAADGRFPLPSLAAANASPGPGEDGAPEEDIEDDIEDDIVSDIEGEVEDSVEDSVSDTIEDSIEDSIIDNSGPGGGDLDDDVEQQVEDKIESELEDNSGPGGGKIEDKIEDGVVQEVEGQSGPGPNSGPGNIDDDAEQKVIGNSGEGSESSGPGSAEEQASGGNDDGDDDGGSGESGHDGANSGPGSKNSGHGEDDDDGKSGDGKSVDPAETFELGFDDDGNPIIKNELLVLVAPDALTALTEHGYAPDRVDTLDGLDLILARVTPPEGRSFAQASQDIAAFAPNAEFDYNHLYSTEAGPTGKDGLRGAPADAFSDFRLPDGGAAKTFGLIDTSLDMTHPALARAAIKTADFVPYTAPRPTEHGSAVASILVGNDSAYRGVAPKAKILAASVFFTTPEGVSAATTESLVEALDWLAGAGAHIVNMSLTGPPNVILKAAVQRAMQRGITVVAAVGNEGPAAAPRYPAAYPEVVAVTAVDARKKIYRYANRGDYVDFAAPGVDVIAAAVGGGYALRTGTSFAAPFVSATLARSSDPTAGLSPESLEQLKETAEDLGAPGFDPVYGNGYIREPKDE